jgi:hypothetical protein
MCQACFQVLGTKQAQSLALEACTDLAKSEENTMAKVMERNHL